MLKKKTLYNLLVAFLVAGIFIPLANVDAQSEKILNVAIASEPPSIDPALGNENI